MSDRVGNWALGTAGICKAGPGTRQCKTSLGSVGKCRTVSDRDEQDREGGNKGRSVPNRAGQDLAWSAEPDRGGKGNVRQCRDMHDMVNPGWVCHGTIGREGRGRAVSCKAGHGRAGSSSVGQGRTGQRQTDWIRAAPARTGQNRAGLRSTGQDRKGPRRVAQCRTGLSKTWQDLA